MTNEAKVLKKKDLFCQKKKKVFCYFLKFGSLIFLEITYNDRLRQCLTSRRDKTQEKYLGPKFGPNKPKSGSKLGVL